MLRHRPRSKFNSTFVLGASGWMSSRLSGAVRAELGGVTLQDPFTTFVQSLGTQPLPELCCCRFRAKDDDRTPGHLL